ncbi:MAG: ATP-binding cassette domain-containing protein [Bdellovibrionaceae bacterium]|nr:ATP-binding cassette domain-containing protein [Pseudobdellovibrionaceae bacterium]
MNPQDSLETTRLDHSIILKANHLKKYFDQGSRQIKAVDDVSLSIQSGEILGLVGESGSGKSTLGKLLIRLLESTSGEIQFRGENFLSLSGQKLRNERRNIQMIFQDPYGSLDPRMTVAQLLSQPFEIHGLLSAKERKTRVQELLKQVGLDETALDRTPHEFSGGQRQRLCIARAIALNPELIICDEPVSSLDVSIQAQILNLLKDLQKSLNMSYLFISHDLSVIEFLCDRVAVMYLGKIVEVADRNQLFAHPKHPYTQALIAALPRFGEGKKQIKTTLSGEVPDPTNPPSGCAFHPRCSQKIAGCAQNEPVLVQNGNHLVSCWLTNPKKEESKL